jgi:methionyl-tRNA synthetase
MQKFYITTPIYYVNGVPHIGHAYTSIVADTLARWRRSQGEDVIFSMGVDENAQKNVNAAKKAGEEINAYIDRMAAVWESTWQKMGMSNTDFIRTTEERHIPVVNEIWARMEAAGDLYKGKYEGLYCIGHEAFISEDELVDGLCPEHQTKPEFVSEENYFFRLSKYQQPLLEFYEAHEDFVAPVNRFQEVKSFVERGLEDTSFSREHKEWGIPVPNDPSHRIYVWADALVNYITEVGVEGWEDHPADIHTVGKDILRFHAILWPAMLMSAGLPLPGQVAANGFLTVNNTKISKTIGNVIDPLELTERYGVDALRYFLLREIPYGADGDFSEEKMKERYNGDLANGLGNFAARVLTLAEKEELAGGKLDAAFDEEVREARRAVISKMNELRFHEALQAIWSLVAFGDHYVNEEKLWAIEDEKTRREKLSNAVLLLEAIATALVPFLPETSRKILAAIEHDGDVLKVKKIDILFPRLK